MLHQENMTYKLGSQDITRTENWSPAQIVQIINQEILTFDVELKRKTKNKKNTSIC